jgi:hypothetical protein
MVRGERPKRYVLASSGVASMVGILYLLYRHYITTTLVPEALVNSQYKFQVYCPINKISYPLQSEVQLVDQFKDSVNELRLLAAQMLATRASDVDQYIIYYQMRTIEESTHLSKLFFCSFVTVWDKPDCATAVPACTVPGPLFYVQRHRPIEVAFVYDIRNKGGQVFALSYTPCMSPTGYNIPYCRLMQKKQGFETCTYQSPTNMIPNNTYEHVFQMSLNNIPVVTHVHGMEVRPSLDGNPLAWLGPAGEVGVAYQSLLFGESYFNSGCFQ